MKENFILANAKQVLNDEADAIAKISEKIDGNFEKCIELILRTRGKLVISGIGKSGHIGRKFASTLASTGTPAFFVNPSECLHGDFGMIAENDSAVLISKSGESPELREMVAYLKRINVKYCAITNKADSFLAKNAHTNLLLHIEKEACPLNLAPTTSSTVTLALCDAIAVALMHERGFEQHDFAQLHPAGSLGKQLSSVERLMHKGEDLPIVHPSQKIKDILFTIIEKKLGMALVTDEESSELLGVISDGDFKRMLAEMGAQALEEKAENVMTKEPKTITKNALVGEAIATMEGRFTALVVVEQRKPVGLIHIHDILKYKAI